MTIVLCYYRALQICDIRHHEFFNALSTYLLETSRGSQLLYRLNIIQLRLLLASMSASSNTDKKTLLIERLVERSLQLPSPMNKDDTV
jgi:hypothetical protein